MGKLTFKKHEKLSSEKAIQELFQKGSFFYLSPFKVLSVPQPVQSASSQVLISVPARNFKRAVDRNKIKRRIREAYRLNKSRFESGSKLLIAYIYVAKDILPSAEIHQKLPLTLEKLYAAKEKK